MRERLIKLIKEADDICSKKKQCEGCIGLGEGEECINFLIADHLLANGVIVPPCKVGDKTFLLLEKIRGGYDIVESYCVKITDNGYGKYFSMAIDCVEIGNSLEFDLCDFGKTVFLTREEAEAALKGR